MDTISTISTFDKHETLYVHPVKDQKKMLDCLALINMPCYNPDSEYAWEVIMIQMDLMVSHVLHVLLYESHVMASQTKSE